MFFGDPSLNAPVIPQNKTLLEGCNCGPEGGRPCTEALCRQEAAAQGYVTTGALPYYAFAADCLIHGYTYNCGCSFTNGHAFWGSGGQPTAFGEITMTDQYQSQSGPIECAAAGS